MQESDIRILDEILRSQDEPNEQDPGPSSPQPSTSKASTSRASTSKASTSKALTSLKGSLSGIFTRRKKRMIDEGMQAPPGKRENIDQLHHIVSPDPIDITLSEPSRQPSGKIQSQLRDEEEHEELRSDDHFFHMDSVKE